MVKSSVGPSQVTVPFVKCGVTVIVSVTGDVPAFVALNEAMFPEPDAGKPIPADVVVHV